jgi:hypothetical protein
VARILNSVRTSLRGLLRRFGWGAPDESVSAEPKLTGAPGRLRLKTYSSESGQVYQYVYRGQHSAADATRFVFSVTVNRKDWMPISVILERRTIEDWQRADGRSLRAVDLYAIAKMSLFESFDRSAGAVVPSPIHPSAGDISRCLDVLGLL